MINTGTIGLFNNANASQPFLESAKSRCRVPVGPVSSARSSRGCLKVLLRFALGSRSAGWSTTDDKVSESLSPRRICRRQSVVFHAASTPRTRVPPAHGLSLWPVLAEPGRFPGLLCSLETLVGREIFPSSSLRGVQGGEKGQKKRPCPPAGSRGKTVDTTVIASDTTGSFACWQTGNSRLTARLLSRLKDWTNDHC